MALNTLLFLLFLSPLIHGICTPPGAVYHVPELTADNPLIAQLSDNLTSIISALVSDPEARGVYRLNQTSFSLGLTSTKETLWEFHYTAPIQGNHTNSRPTNVTGDTVYMIGSVTKVFTVLGVLLQNGVNLEDPVTKYVPELTQGGNLGGVKWEEITLRELGSHLSGIAREYGNDIVGSLDPSALEQAGLPPVNPNVIPCDKNTTDRACTRAEFFQGFKERPAIFYPGDRASYSNAAFTILGYALESITGKSYEQIMEDEIFSPLDMRHSSLTTPRDSEGIIPFGANAWNAPALHGNAAGGIYSSTTDLLKFLRAILTNTILPRPKIEAWLKPASYSGSFISTYGMPWENYRSNQITPDGRIITLYTKSGGVPGYTSLIVLLPDYGIAASILIADGLGLLTTFFDGFARQVVPVVDEIARAQTETLYAGRYSASEANTSVTLTVDDGPGIRITEFVSNGVNWLQSVTYNPELDVSSEARLYPTGLNENGRFPWRYELNLPRGAENATEGLWGEICLGDVDAGQGYGGQPLNEFVFEMEDGVVTGVRLTGFRVTLTKE